MIPPSERPETDQLPLPVRLRNLADYAEGGPQSRMVTDMIGLMREAASLLPVASERPDALQQARTLADYASHDYQCAIAVHDRAVAGSGRMPTEWPTCSCGLDALLLVQRQSLEKE
jgi:hypothetical protein